MFFRVIKMKFCEQLNFYIEKLDCTAKELGERSGLSSSTLSRYRSGERVPEGSGEGMESLCRAVFEMFKGVDRSVTLENIKNSFLSCSDVLTVDRAEFLKKFDVLVFALDFNVSEMCPFVNYDASSLSRFKSGSRQPADPIKFADGTAEFIFELIRDDREKREKAAGLFGCEEDMLCTKESVVKICRSWLLYGKREEDRLGGFLEKLDEFDLNEYIKAIKFDSLKVPSLPFQLPTSKKYTGLKAMMDSELDFLKATVLSKSSSPVIMYSDMPMAEMAKDADFPKKWMFGMALMLKKGLVLKQIHNLDRSFEDMMLGLESWIPMYMTGQICPYYFENVQGNVFHHLLKVSGAAALSGEAMKGFHADGRYYLTKSKDELAYYQKRADEMIENALPLMEIYTADKKGDYLSFAENEAKKGGRFKNLLSAPPIYTAPPEFLKSMLGSHRISGKKADEILAFAKGQREIFEKCLEKGSITDEIPPASAFESVFGKDGQTDSGDNGTESQGGDSKGLPFLDLSEMFFEGNIPYTKDEYAEHIAYTVKLADSIQNYSADFSDRQIFKNLQIRIKLGEWAIVSKAKSPSIHFCIRHPRLREAIENFYPIINEQQ